MGMPITNEAEHPIGPLVELIAKLLVEQDAQHSEKSEIKSPTN